MLVATPECPDHERQRYRGADRARADHASTFSAQSYSAFRSAAPCGKALDMAYEQRGRPQNVLFHSDSKNVIASVSGWPDPHSDGPIRDDLAS